MTEFVMLCAFVDKVLYGNTLGDFECEAPATFSLIMHGGDEYDGKHIESCDFHLVKMARGLAELYAVDSVTIEDLA